MLLAPTRELALQTARFVRELGKHLDLRVATLVRPLPDSNSLCHVPFGCGQLCWQLSGSLMVLCQSPGCVPSGMQYILVC